MNSKGEFFTNLFGVFVLACLVTSIIFILPIKFIQTTDNGVHTGYVTAVEHSGLIWKTWTVYFKTDVQSSQEDRYCVIDGNVVNELIVFQLNKTQVNIEFEDYFFVGLPLCAMNDEEIITGVNIK